MKTLLQIAGMVQAGGKNVTAKADEQAARTARRISKSTTQFSLRQLFVCTIAT